MAFGRVSQVQQLLLVGDPGVGKTSLVRRLLGDGFDELYQATERPEWRQKVLQVDGVTCNLQIRDVPGIQAWHDGVQTVGGTGVAVVYSCTSPESFSHAGSFLQRLLSQCSAKCVLIASKCDEFYKRVSASQALDFARSLNIPFLETSAKTNFNVERCFQVIAEELSRENGEAFALPDFSVEEVRQALGLGLEVDTAQARSYSTYSPPLVLSPDSPDSLIDDDQAEEIALVEECGEGKNTLGLVRMDVQTAEMSTQTEEFKEGFRKRGANRKYPTKKKKEELDKFWLRQFRRYMKRAYTELKGAMVSAERAFWKRYLSPELKPDKDRQFKSYNKDYKLYLFKNPFFSSRFREWFSSKGESMLAKKFERDSDGFRTYFDYALGELVTMGDGEVADPDEMIMEY